MNESVPNQTEQWRERLQRFRARVKIVVPFATGVLAALVGLLLYNALFPPPKPLTTRDVNETVAQVLASATPPPAFSALVYQQIQPSLVYIEVKLPGKHGGSDDAVGSGVIVDDAGAILTSLHVVSDATEIQLTFADGTKSSAQIVTAQPENDIAVLQAATPPAQIVPAVLGNPNAVHVGDDAYVVGNPLGLYGSMSSGVISGLNRSFKPPEGERRLQGLIQIDAAVNPGNSGGPLLNRDGQVIGIVAALINPTGQDAFAGIGLAVPINVAGAAAGLPPD
jgi:S1-C subfamily serine protease